jgi:hypothetical protein
MPTTAHLSQIIAIEKGKKSQANTTFTGGYHAIQKPALLTGISRAYRPKDDEGEQLPSESTRVQLTAEKVIEDVAEALTSLFDVTATKEWGNTLAKADIVIDGEVLVPGVPVTYLLFLEKQLTDLHTFVGKLPMLDPAESWSHDPTAPWWRTEPVRSNRTKKIPRNHVKAEATDRHPAQVEVYYEDVTVGYWDTVKFSGALPADTINGLQARVVALQHAVKFAREKANQTVVEDKYVGDLIFGYLIR